MCACAQLHSLGLACEGPQANQATSPEIRKELPASVIPVDWLAASVAQAAESCMLCSHERWVLERLQQGSRLGVNTTAEMRRSP
jgi:hypothetical protein